ncbi:MAG: ABC transporter permease subunit [Acidobacteriota bacterium]
MFGLIVRKELRDILATPRFAATFAVISLLILLAFHLAGHSFELAREQYEAASTESLRQMEGLTDWLDVSPQLMLPPQPLASLVPGITNDVGRQITVRGLGTLRASQSRYNEDPILAIFRFLDLEFIFQVVLSLFAILFAFDAVSGEKEQGTLRLALSNAVPRSTWILGKLCGTGLALTLPLLIPLLAGGLILLVMGIPMAAGDWLRLAMVLLAGLLYVGAFLGLSILVSALTHRSATSFLVLLVLWILAVLVVPRSAVLLAARSVDVPTVDEGLSQLGRLRSQLWSEDQQAIGQYLQDNMSEPDSPDAANRMVAGFNAFFQERSEARSHQLEELEVRLAEARRNRQAVQEKLAFGLARLSPAAAFSIAATGLADTALALPRHYLDQAKAYREVFERFQKEKSGGRSSGGIRIAVRVASADGETPEEEPAIDPRELPAFEYAPPSTASVVRDTAPDLALLALYNLLFFAGAFVAFLRYDVR